MRESDIVLRLAEEELKKRTDRINHFENCPHCGKPMDIGSMGPGTFVLGCYHNPDCPFKTKQKRTGFKESFRVDLNSDTTQKHTLERELVIIKAHQFFEDVEQLGNVGEIDTDLLHETAETVKQLYDKLVRMWKVIERTKFEELKEE